MPNSVQMTPTKTWQICLRTTISVYASHPPQSRMPIRGLIPLRLILKTLPSLSTETPMPPPPLAPSTARPLPLTKERWPSRLVVDSADSGQNRTISLSYDEGQRRRWRGKGKLGWKPVEGVGQHNPSII